MSRCGVWISCAVQVEHIMKVNKCLAQGLQLVKYENVCRQKSNVTKQKRTRYSNFPDLKSSQSGHQLSFTNSTGVTYVFIETGFFFFIKCSLFRFDSTTRLDLQAFRRLRFFHTKILTPLGFHAQWIPVKSDLHSYNTETPKLLINAA